MDFIIRWRNNWRLDNVSMVSLKNFCQSSFLATWVRLMIISTESHWDILHLFIYFFFLEEKRIELLTLFNLCVKRFFGKFQFISIFSSHVWHSQLSIKFPYMITILLANIFRNVSPISRKTFKVVIFSKFYPEIFSPPVKLVSQLSARLFR